MYFKTVDTTIYCCPEPQDYNQYAIGFHLNDYSLSLNRREESLLQLTIYIQSLMAVLWSIEYLEWDDLNLRHLRRIVFPPEDLQKCIDTAAEHGNHQVYLTLLQMKEKYVEPIRIKEILKL